MLMKGTADLDGLRLVLDPGHGGCDTGIAAPGGIQEAAWTLQVALALGERCRALGATVVETRAGDTFVPRLLRTELIREVRPNVTVSLHLGWPRSRTRPAVSIGSRWWQRSQAAPLHHHLITAFDDHGLSPHPPWSTYRKSRPCATLAAPAHTLLVTITAHPPLEPAQPNAMAPLWWAQAVAQGLRAYGSGRRRLEAPLTTSDKDGGGTPSRAQPPALTIPLTNDAGRAPAAALPLVPGVRLPLVGVPLRFRLDYPPTQQPPPASSTGRAKK